MNLRKNPEKDLRKLSGLFFQIGLLSALLITVSAFEWTTAEIKPVVQNPDWLGDDVPFVQPTIIEEKKPPKPKKVTLVEVKKEDPEEPAPEDFLPEFTEPADFPEPAAMPPIDEKPDDEAVTYTDQMPEPVGGMEAFYRYVAKNITYTRQARNLHLEGKVFVQFVVDKEGNLTEVTVVRGLGAGLDEEAKKVMENAPAWNPGRQSGRRVKVRMIIPIHFRLQ